MGWFRRLFQKADSGEPSEKKETAGVVTVKADSGEPSQEKKTASVVI